MKLAAKVTAAATAITTTLAVKVTAAATTTATVITTTLVIKVTAAATAITTTLTVKVTAAATATAAAVTGRSLRPSEQRYFWAGRLTRLCTAVCTLHSLHSYLHSEQSA
ncbi:hypothetical protein FHG87_022022 [Trinorchestia longiramus]|nr:hypothetical protein FHG87_022022 [Trinorchestia longiramus]